MEVKEIIENIKKELLFINPDIETDNIKYLFKKGIRITLEKLLCDLKSAQQTQNELIVALIKEIENRKYKINLHLDYQCGLNEGIELSLNAIERYRKKIIKDGK